VRCLLRALGRFWCDVLRQEDAMPKPLNAVDAAALAHFPDMPDDGLISVKVVAVLRSESVATTWRNIKRGELAKPIKVGPQTSRLTVGQARAYLLRARAQPASA
jgi:hypothetical protein